MKIKQVILILLCLLFFCPVFAGKKLALLITLTPTNPTCGKFNGRIVVTVSGGTAPYSYSINGNTPQSSNVFIYVGPGTHNITVTDASSQTGNASATLTNQFSPPTGVTWTTTSAADCVTPNGSITLTGSGGTLPYTYSIDRTNFQASNFFPNLHGGSYWAAVKDANGCISPFVLLTANVSQVCQIRQNGTNQTSVCSPYRSHLALLNVSGGNPPYLYSLDGINFQVSNDFYPLGPGLHTVTVKDATGQLMKYTVALQNPCTEPFKILLTASSAQCGQNGSITVTASEGVAPYVYSIDGINFQSSNQFTGLIPGNYTITVRDADGIVSSAISVVRNSCLAITATSISSTCGNNNGSITAQATGGSAPYLFALGAGPFTTNNQFQNLAAGTYTISVRDANGSTGNTSITITGIPGPTISSVNTTPASCTGSDGTLSIQAQNGTAPLQYSINGVNFQAASSFTGLAAGSYTVMVKDNNGCTASTISTVITASNINANAGADATICEGKSITLNAISNATVFSWSPGTGLSNTNILNPVATPRSTTTYTLTASTGACNVVSSVTITVNNAPLANAGNDTAICAGQNAVLHATGGVGYTWSPATYLDNASSANPVVINPPAGQYTYSVVVKDINGCSSLSPDNVTLDVIKVSVDAGNDTITQSAQPLQLMARDINNTGFISYSWSPATGLNNPTIKNPVAVLTSDISYTLTAVSTNGCIATDNLMIKVFKDIDIYVPSAFTPNNDGLNDVVKAIPIGIREFKLLTIYDRAGQVMFHTNNAAAGWNGNYKGYPLYGTFVWLAEGIDYNGKLVRRKGTVNIIR